MMYKVRSAGEMAYEDGPIVADGDGSRINKWAIGDEFQQPAAPAMT